jgi:hypothetical protein
MNWDHFRWDTRNTPLLKLRSTKLDERIKYPTSVSSEADEIRLRMALPVGRVATFASGLIKNWAKTLFERESFFKRLITTYKGKLLFSRQTRKRLVKGLSLFRR